MTTETQVEFIPQERFDRREFRVGDVLWFAPSERRFHSCSPVSIEKVGRKWVYLSSGNPPHRFDPGEGMFIDGRGYLSPGRLFANPESHQEESRRNKLWVVLRLKLRERSPIREVTTDDILAAAKLLRLEIET